MKTVPVDEGCLFVALALVPGFASRNRHPDLYASAAAMRARTRARRMRAFLQSARDADEARVEHEAGRGVVLVVVRNEPRSTWRLVGDDLDAAVCRYLLERGGAMTPGQKRLFDALPAEGRARVTAALEAMPRLLGLA
jgi:hypothetical protein